MDSSVEMPVSAEEDKHHQNLLRINIICSFPSLTHHLIPVLILILIIWMLGNFKFLVGVLLSLAWWMEASVLEIGMTRSAQVHFPRFRWEHCIICANS